MNVPTGWHGSFNWLRNYGSGTILQAREMAANLRPLEQAALERLNDWLPKLSHPVRIGEHDQTAFALGLMLDYARATGDHEICRPAGIESSAVLSRGQRLSIGI